jgi:FSR family fosmidomycin resistance protein-like MFS transporter
LPIGSLCDDKAEIQPIAYFDRNTGMTQPLEITSEVPEREGFTDYSSIALLSAGHLTDDINQGVVPAMLPFLIASGHLNYASAAGLVFAQSMASSVVQPLFGILADRKPAPWLIPVGLSMAGFGAAMAGLAPSYPLMFTAIALSGLGVAAFHPEAARWTRYLGGKRQGTAMSLFFVGGNAGFAIGPLLITPALAAFGLKGSLVLAVPVLIMSTVIFVNRHRFSHSRFSNASSHAHLLVDAPEQWLPFVGLMTVVMVRSIVFFGLNTFVPIYWTAVLGQSKVQGGAALTMMLTASAFGTLSGGWMADRYGRRRVVVFAMAALPILIFMLTKIRHPAAEYLVLIPIGFTMAVPASVMVVMAQEYLPNRVGLASGVTLGFSVTLGGMMMPLLGAVADRHGLQAAIVMLAIVPAIGFLMSLRLKEPSGTVHPKH